METTAIQNDIVVICQQAASFPEGVDTAHRELNAKLAGRPPRPLFGISRPEDGKGIVYRAAATELYAGEAAELGCGVFTIRKGTYASILIRHYVQDLPGIQEAFSRLLAEPGIDPQGYCLEQYEGADDVRCMVPLIQTNQ